MYISATRMEEGQEGKQLEEYIRHKHGRADLSQQFECMVELMYKSALFITRKG